MENDGVTCIKPTTSKHKLSKFKKLKPGEWFSQDPRSTTFDYGVSDPQFKFLRLLSSTANQKFKYMCQNSIGWYDAANDNYDKAIHLRGYNDKIIKYKKQHEPFETHLKVISDECKKGKGTGSVILELNTREVDLLPFADYRSFDFGNGHQKHGFELGEVCFVG